MLDYNCERNKMDVKQSSQLINSQKGLAIGNGLVMYLSLLIPFIGVMFIAPLSAVAASIAFYKKNPQTL
jgi:CysZ protein